MTGSAAQLAVQVEAELLGPRLFEGMSTAIQDAERRLAGFEHAKYPHLRPLTVRASLREFLEREGLPGGWVLDGNPCLMGQLCLAESDLGLRFRVLKERRLSYPGGVPVAGPNAARRDVWQDGLFSRTEALPASGATISELLLLWDYADAKKVNEGFTLRIVHPIEAGIHGRPVRIDLDLAVRSGGEIFARRTFAGDHEEQDFFQADIAAEQDE